MFDFASWPQADSRHPEMIVAVLERTRVDDIALLDMAQCLLAMAQSDSPRLYTTCDDTQ